MRDIRLLTLLKQHYMEKYPRPLKCQYSCLGYYDGIDIEAVPFNSSQSQLFSKRSEAPISEVWYSTGRKARELNGRHSTQSIGIFRCAATKEQADHTNSFWEANHNMPFFAIGFLQLSERSNYMQISNDIENIESSGNSPNERECRIITYCTYDNADLVVLMQSNSISEIAKASENIEKMPSIRYMHSIMGISESYLHSCQTAKEILSCWNGLKCFIEDDVKSLMIHMVTSGDADVLRKLRFILDDWNAKYKIKGYQDAVWSYTIGHGNIILSIRNTNMKSVILLMLPGSFSTHQNIVYEEGVYNIETSLTIAEEPWDTLSPLPCKGGQLNRTSWCCRLIDKYTKKLDIVFAAGNEGLYSCYQALIRTLNTLAQYEQFELSKDIFYLLFPAFSTFDEHLDILLNSKKGSSENSGNELAKKHMHEFLEAVNSVIYHIVHTDQMYLMIPGYCGSPFSVPIKLNLMALWLIDAVTEVLNDSPGNRYACILTPELELHPSTKEVLSNLSANNELIYVRLSQRSLFLPRDLILILVHELAHYVGEDIRERRLRAQNMIKTMSYFIAEKILPDEYEGDAVTQDESTLFSSWKADTKSSIEKAALKFLTNRVRETCTNKAFYAKDISLCLKKACQEFLADESRELHNIICNFSPEYFSQFNGHVNDSRHSFVNAAKYLCHIQDYVNRNRITLLASGDCEPVINELIKIYREVFSDMAAAAILKCDEDDFHEAFQVSEGMLIDSGNKPTQQIIREAIACTIAFTPGCKDVNILLDARFFSPINAKEKFWENIYAYTWTRTHLQDYAKACFHRLSAQIDTPKIASKADEIRQLFDLFKGKENFDCFHIYEQIIKRNDAYIKKTQAQYKAFIQNMESDSVL